jgi:broad specificity phosphatase PhoE
MVTQIYLIRHGETEWSLSGQHTGRTDLPLTPHGEELARQLRQRLAGKQFDHVLTSPMQRARRTCELAGFGAAARVQPDLHEWDYGDYEGHTSAEIHQQRPGWNIYRDGCPNGESPEQISARADNVIAGLRRLDGMIAIFSHGHFLRILGMRWAGLSVPDGQLFGLDTASISILSYEHNNPNTPIILMWNSV